MFSQCLSFVWQHLVLPLVVKLQEVILARILILVLRQTFNLILMLDNKELEVTVQKIITQIIKEQKWHIEKDLNADLEVKEDIQKSSDADFTKH